MNNMGFMENKKLSSIKPFLPKCYDSIDISNLSIVSQVIFHVDRYFGLVELLFVSILYYIQNYYTGKKENKL